MKGIIGLLGFIAVVAFVGSMALSREAVRDQGRLLAVAFGVPKDDAMQMHLGVPALVPVVDPPEVNARRTPLWNQWIKGHFQLRDELGTGLRLRKKGTSRLMVGETAAGDPSFVVWAELRKGGQYTCDYVPIVGDGKRYRYSFIVPKQPGKVKRRRFHSVTDEES